MDKDLITFDALRAFEVFADHLNFTKAAEELHISQPALHVKVQKLTTGIGDALYVKDGRALHLTPLGRSVVRLAREVEDGIDAFLASIGLPPDAPLVLAAGAGAHRWVIREAVRMLIQRGQKLRLLSTDRNETIEAVRSGRAAVGVTVVDARPPGVSAVALASYPQVVVVPLGHRLARTRSVRLIDLTDEDLVMPPAGRPQREAIARRARSRGVKLHVSAEAEGWAQMLDFVGLGVGICIVNGCVEPADGCVGRPIEDLPRVTYTALFRTAERREPTVQRLLEALQASAP